MTGGARSAARTAQQSTTFRAVARAGYVVLGILHIAIGGIATSIATGGGGEADQGGAIAQLQRAPLGNVLLWVIIVGLAALAVWQIAEAFLDQDPDTKKKWGHRLKYLGTAVAYVGIAVTALVYALGGQSDSSSSSTSFSAQLLSTPGGVFLLVLVGLIITGVGVAFVVRGITQKFVEQLSLPSSATARKGIVAFGVAGYVAKGIAVGVTGILFVVAAFTHDPEKAGGLHAALHALAALPFGAVILWVVGAGLVIYGLYCFARARYARM